VSDSHISSGSWKIDFEYRSIPRLAVNINAPAALLDDAENGPLPASFVLKNGSKTRD
jgi:hypothetical protein